MRKWTILLAVAAIVLPGAAMAVVLNSMHDIDAYKTVEGNKGGACAYCHVPHGAAGAKLYPTAITPVPGTRWKESTQVVSLICTQCHDLSATVITSANRTVAPFNDNAHRDSWSTLRDWSDINTIPAGVKVDNISQGINARLECSSCHDVHAQEYRPFLAHTSTAGDINTNCIKCHPNRSNPDKFGPLNTVAFSGASSGNASQHPTNIATGDTAGGDAENWVTFDAAFSTAADAGTSAYNAATWQSRGKLNLSSKVGCQTCHTVHGVESAAAQNTSVFNPQGNKGSGTVILAKAFNVSAGKSAFCEGCHATNPAGTSMLHPVNVARSFDVTGTAYAKQWTWGDNGAITGILVCDTCHDVHYGTDNSAILRRKALNSAFDDETAASFTDSSSFCGECHGAGGVGKVNFNPSAGQGNHHPVSYMKDGITPLELIFEGTANANIFRDSGTDNLFMSTAAQIAWNTRTRTTPSATGYVWGLLQTTKKVMTCQNCHAGATGGSLSTIQAHGAGTIAGLNVRATTESEFCVDCHTFNPSKYAQKYEKGVSTISDNSTMTHYVGTIATAGYKYTTAWSPTAHSSIYSTDGGGNGSIICESCHFWGRGNLQATNTGATGHSATLTQNTVDGMIQKAGNNDAPGSGAPLTNMCTGCHGGSPGSGSSHPTTPTVQSAASSSVQAYIGTQGSTDHGKATLTSGNLANCESCHRPHNATIGTGALILEGGPTTPASTKPAFQLASDNTGGTALNQEGACIRCHLQGR